MTKTTGMGGMKPPPGLKGALSAIAAAGGPTISGPASASIAVPEEEVHPLYNSMEKFIEHGKSYALQSTEVLRNFTTIKPEQFETEKVEIFKSFQDNSIMRIAFNVKVSVHVLKDILITPVSNSGKNMPLDAKDGCKITSILLRLVRDHCNISDGKIHHFTGRLALDEDMRLRAWFDEHYVENLNKADPPVTAILFNPDDLI